jgi:hypothetical protein
MHAGLKFYSESAIHSWLIQLEALIDGYVHAMQYHVGNGLEYEN